MPVTGFQWSTIPTTRPIASWLYALGVARFTSHHFATSKAIPQQVWVSPQDAENGERVFELTGHRAFDFFGEQIGPYAYETLAHVQAAGLGDGTEHASVIFYGEKGVASGNAPVVHEVAPVVGKRVTERDWDDVWLSEGVRHLLHAALRRAVRWPRRVRARPAQQRGRILLGAVRKSRSRRRRRSRVQHGDTE
jgi:aminopeptidase N